MSYSKNPFTKRLKEARLTSGLSQKKLGIAAGIDEFSASARFNQYENGKHLPDFLTLKRIAKVLKVPPAYFYADDDLLAELLVEYEKLSKSSRAKILKVCKKLSSERNN